MEAPRDVKITLQWWKLGLQALVTAGLVAALLHCVDLRGLVSRFSHARPVPLLAAVAFSVVSLAIMAQRWRQIVRNDGAAPSLRSLFICYLESMFFGLFLPSAMGGDVYRGLRIYTQVGGARKAAVNILTERFVGVWGICLLGLVGLVSGGVRRTPLGGGFLSLYAVVIIVSVLVVSKSVQTALSAGLRHIRLGRLADAHDLVVLQMHGYFKAPGLLTSLFVLTIAQQFAGSVSAYFVGASAGLSLSLPFYLVAMPLTWLAGLIPALGGIGPREGTFAYLAIVAGADSEGAVAASGLLLAVRVALGLLGGTVLLARTLRHRTRSASALR